MWLRTVVCIVILALSIFVAPLASDAQPAGKVYRIGILEAIPAAQNAANLAALRNEHELIHAGSCDRWGTVIKGDVLVRDWASGSALATLLE